MITSGNIYPKRGMVGLSHFPCWHMKSTINTKSVYSCLPAFTSMHNFTGQSKHLFQTDYYNSFYSILFFLLQCFMQYMCVAFVSFQYIVAVLCHVSCQFIFSIIQFQILIYSSVYSMILSE